MDSIYIMLIPDDDYRAVRPKIKEPHLSLASFEGLASTLSDRSIERLRSTVLALARSTPLSVVANGIGMFDDGADGVAVVDLIDSVEVTNLRRQIENLFGYRAGYTLDELRLDYRHGFTPHITREYLAREDLFYAEIGPDMIDNVEFTFNAVAMWCGDNRFEVSL